MLSTLRPFYDFRGLSLLALCAVIGLVTDPAATLGLAGYLAYVIGMAGAALMLAKVVMPYLDASEHAASALFIRDLLALHGALHDLHEIREDIILRHLHAPSSFGLGLLDGLTD